MQNLPVGILLWLPLALSRALGLDGLQRSLPIAQIALFSPSLSHRLHLCWSLPRCLLPRSYLPTVSSGDRRSHLCPLPWSLHWAAPLCDQHSLPGWLLQWHCPPGERVVLQQGCVFTTQNSELSLQKNGWFEWLFLSVKKVGASKHF